MRGCSTDRFAAELYGDRRQFDEHPPAVGPAAAQAPQRRGGAVRGVVPPAEAVHRRLDDQHDRPVRHGGRTGDVHRLQLHDSSVHRRWTGTVEQPASVPHFPAL